MQGIDVVVSTDVKRSSRVMQIESIFDVPMVEKSRLEWKGQTDIDERPWNVGLIVGPSGSGKTVIGSKLFGAVEKPVDWSRTESVLDGFPSTMSIEDITKICQSVGFNTIPAWMRPYHVLSNGERFRVEIARVLASEDDPMIIDEFTSVVDRQVAKIVSHAVQKHVRKSGRRFVAISCHYDIIDWLQPDWILEPTTMKTTWRSLQRRPELHGEIFRTDLSTWKLFAPYHYLSASLLISARCYVLTIDGRPASFVGVVHRIGHPKLEGVSRLVTLPDYQGLGLAFVLLDKLGEAHKAIGKDFATYPAHPPLIRSFMRSRNWKCIKSPGMSRRCNMNTTGKIRSLGNSVTGGRPNAVFRYIGPAMEKTDALMLLG